MADVTWVKDQGAKQLDLICRNMKNGMKRSIYNRIEKCREQIVEATRVLNPSKRGVEQFHLWRERVKVDITGIRQSAMNINLMVDQDVTKTAAKVFDTIKVTSDYYEGHFGRLEITWKGTVHYIGDMRIRYLASPSIRQHHERIRVFNDDRPGEASVPHPHVQNDGLVCFGTWKEMMSNYAGERWNWLRCLVMVADFITYYTPQGTPYQKLGAGWRNRHVRGERLCAECDRVTSGCTCIRQGTPCPKTGDMLAVFPDPGYCTGCTRWVTEAMLRPYGRQTRDRQGRGLCGGNLPANEWLERNLGTRPEVQPGAVWTIPQTAVQATLDNVVERQQPVMSMPEFTLDHRLRYVYAEGPTGTVYRCRRPMNVGDGAPEAQASVGSLSIVRMVNSELSDTIRTLGLVEYATDRPVRMVVRVRAVLRPPSFLELMVQQGGYTTYEQLVDGCVGMFPHNYSEGDDSRDVFEVPAGAVLLWVRL